MVTFVLPAMQFPSCWHYEKCVVLDGNLLDELSFDGNLLDEDVNRMCFHMTESLDKGIVV